MSELNEKKTSGLNEEELRKAINAPDVREMSTDEKIEQLAGVFSKNTATVKKDRAIEIAELLETELKRRVEDRRADLKSLERKKKSSLDLSPDTTYSIMKVKDFEPREFVDYYLDLQLKIREEKVRLNAAMLSYNELFGYTFHIEPIL